MIEGALFVRFGEVFEGLLPVRRLVAASGSRSTGWESRRWGARPAAVTGWAIRSGCACSRSTVRAAACCSIGSIGSAAEAHYTGGLRTKHERKRPRRSPRRLLVIAGGVLAVVAVGGVAFWPSTTTRCR